jgi:hypothetical protein
MPYVPQKRRAALAQPGSKANDAGELNYQITRLLVFYTQHHGLKYKTINDISGACNEALAEYRRRVVGPYEDTKIEENGDVYPWLLEGGPSV